MMNVYVASSWRNPRQPVVVKALRAAGYEVYDFHNPEPGDNGFHWSEIDPQWQTWSPRQFREALKHPLARAGFDKDMDALMDADVCVLIQPCGISAHLELGWAVAVGLKTIVLLADGEPELMYAMADQLVDTVQGVVKLLDALEEDN